MPLRWNELRPQLRADRYTVQNVRRRLAALNSDPWQDFDLACQAITDAMLPAPFRTA
jgi:bifunctional non-homologous end joining protein LigD